MKIEIFKVFDPENKCVWITRFLKGAAEKLNSMKTGRVEKIIIDGGKGDVDLDRLSRDLYYNRDSNNNLPGGWDKVR